MNLTREPASVVARTTKDGKKRCCRCRETKELKHFARNKAQADGYAQMCRPCRRQSDRKASKPAEKPARSSGSKPKTLTKPEAPQRQTSSAPASEPPPRPGPPSDITPALIEAICEVLRRGHSHSAAARKCGVPEDTFHQWMHRGREAKEGPTRDLFLAVLQADGEGEHALVELVRTGAEFDPKEARWMLERRFGWVKREHLTVETGSELQQRQQEAKTLRERLRDKLVKLVTATVGAGAAVAAPPTGADSAAGAAPAGADGPAVGSGSQRPVQPEADGRVAEDPPA